MLPRIADPVNRDARMKKIPIHEFVVGFLLLLIVKSVKCFISIIQVY